MWWVYSKGTHSDMVLFQLFSGSYNSARYMAISKKIINIWLQNTHMYIYNIYYIVYTYIYILYYICVCTPFTDTYIAYIIQYHTRNSLHTVYVQHSPSLASHGFPARPRDCLDWKISAMPLTSLTAIRCSERQGDIQQQQGRHKWHKPWWLTLHSRGIATNMGKTVKQCHKPPWLEMVVYTTYTNGDGWGWFMTCFTHILEFLTHSLLEGWLESDPDIYLEID